MNAMELSTFGQRVKHARLASGLTQSEFAKSISFITKSGTVKGLVSQWENNKIANPNNATLLAIQAVTGFAAEWLVSGRGDQSAKQFKLLVSDTKGIYGRGLSREILRRGIIIAATEQTEPNAIADAAVELVETLADDPLASDNVLRRIARLAKTG